MKKTTATEISEANIAQIMNLLAEAPGKLTGLRAQLTDEQLLQPLGTEERSFTQDLAHLLHCEARSVEFICAAILLKDALLPDVHPERDYGKLMRYDLLPCDELLDYFKTRRTILLRVLSALNLKQWSCSSREAGKQRQESVYWRARTIAMHELDHITDLERKLAKMGKGERSRDNA